MNYSFDVDIAKKYGVDESIMIENFRFWIAKNKANGNNQIAGHTWTYNSIPAFCKLFPFWNENRIRRIIESLFRQGILIAGRHGEDRWNRTLWYAFKNEREMLNIPDISPSGKSAGCTGQICQIEAAETPDASGKNGISSIADNKQTYNKPDSKHGNVQMYDKSTTRFKKPSIDEIKAYCTERNNSVDPQRFFDYYESKGWLVGKTPMKNWQAAVRTWERNDNDKKQPPKRSIGGVNENSEF